MGSGPDESDRLTAVILILVAILMKGLVYVICRMLARGRKNSNIAVQAIREDAANDVMMNTGALLCAFPEFWLALFQGWMPKTVITYVLPGMDPLWAFAMSLPILHGWIDTARTQFETLRVQGFWDQIWAWQPGSIACSPRRLPFYTALPLVAVAGLALCAMPCYGQPAGEVPEFMVTISPAVNDIEVFHRVHGLDTDRDYAPNYCYGYDHDGGASNDTHVEGGLRAAVADIDSREPLFTIEEIEVFHQVATFASCAKMLNTFHPTRLG